MKIDFFAYPKASRLLPLLLATAGVVSSLTGVAIAQSTDWGDNNGVKLCPKNSKVGVIAETKKFYVNICYQGSKVKWYSAVEKANLRNRVTRSAIVIEGINRKWVARYGNTRYEVNDSADLRVYKGTRLIFQERFIHFHIVGD